MDFESTPLRRFVWGILANAVLGSFLLPTGLRRMGLSLLGVDLDRSVEIRPHVMMTTNRLVAGPRSVVQAGAIINNREFVTLGTDVGLGQGSLITTVGHDSDDPRRRVGKIRPTPVVIEDGCWVGARSMILSGVTIGAGCIIAAGAVVTRDCAPHGLYAGVPARRIKDLPTRTTD